MNMMNLDNISSETCQNLKVSIIDDSAQATELAMLLEAKGCQVYQCHWLESIPLTLERHTDFFIVDPLCFPDFDFESFFRANTSIPVILWSRIHDLKTRDSYFRCGIIEILCKDETIKETSSALVEFFYILSNNHAFHVTLISADTSLKEELESLIRLRGYQRNYINDFKLLKNKPTVHTKESGNVIRFQGYRRYYINDFKLRKNQPTGYTDEGLDLILMDLRNQDFLDQGLEFIRFLRQDTLADIPIVILLGENDPNIMSKLYRNGVNDIIIHPCDADLILHTFTHHLDFNIARKLHNADKLLSSQLKMMIDSNFMLSKTDPLGIITYVNDQFCRFSGYPKEELIGKPHNIIRHPDNSPLLFQQMWDILHSKQIFHGIIMNRRKNGETFYVDTTIAPVLNNDEILEYISIQHDITQLIEKQNGINVIVHNRAFPESKEASEAESKFLATISHEIRTPLNGILGFAELIDDTPLTSEQKRYLEAIQHSGETLRQIINDILEVMKFSREAPVFENQPLYLIKELEVMIYPFYAQAKKKGVKLITFIDPYLPIMVNTDLLRLKQVLLNLLENAIKFTPSGKNVYLRIKNIYQKDGIAQVSFTVADEGIGIQSEHKSLIFNPFTQADSSIAREFGGTGLGLNIVSRVIEGFGGTIALKSVYGKGTVFNVKLSFESDNQHYPYQFKTGKTYLYLPTSKPSSSFALVERYLKKFKCCEYTILRTAQIHSMIDRKDQTICLFCDLMSFSEISAIIKYFEKTSIYIFPSDELGPHHTPIIQDNVFWVFEPLNWTNLTRYMHIYDEPVCEIDNEQEDITFKELTILVAEDNELNRFYIEEVLKKLSIQYDIARDGYTAVKKFMSGKFDLVLMDINMPNLDGITATRQILQYEKEKGLSHTPIIGLSADAVEKNIMGYIRNGLDGYLIKPMRKSDLVRLLTELFGHHFNQLEIEVVSLTEECTDQNTLSIVATARKLELPVELVTKLYEKYIHNALNLIEQLSHPESPDSLKASIHSLKGISKNLFIESLDKECEKLEADLPKLNDMEQVSRCLELCNHTKKIIEVMQQELQYA